MPYGVPLQRLDIPHKTTHALLFHAVFDYKQGQAESGSIESSTMTDVLLSRSRTAFDISLEMRDDPNRNPLITFKLQVQLMITSYITIGRLSPAIQHSVDRVEEGKLVAM
ncbi:uncharacterized protein BP5553_08947 [Venustampulla echinocandica]|uniref:Uncharacterized protein n=1 Tax=Venustampulla echinocandica TaxID=2656787 RepID=A0A370TDI8_9HELO|nr:uncharacterized protein BP5553_08947 [Venustampulla echinocandica]RDL32491.1 hypothetical protein BP5553_08947 [Venustampulla echinocandica]